MNKKLLGITMASAILIGVCDGGANEYNAKAIVMYAIGISDAAHSRYIANANCWDILPPNNKYMKENITCSIKDGKVYMTGLSSNMKRKIKEETVNDKYIKLNDISDGLVFYVQQNTYLKEGIGDKAYEKLEKIQKPLEDLIRNNN